MILRTSCVFNAKHCTGTSIYGETSKKRDLFFQEVREDKRACPSVHCTLTRAVIIKLGHAEMGQDSDCRVPLRICNEFVDFTKDFN